jgi:hypothetical protein
MDEQTFGLVKQAYDSLHKEWEKTSDRSMKLRIGTQLLHASFVLRDKGHDTGERMLIRGQILEAHGHDMCHLIEELTEQLVSHLDPEQPAMEVLMAELVVGIHRTLASPIDDADKLAHLKESLPPQEKAEGLLKEYAQFKRMTIQ